MPVWQQKKLPREIIEELKMLYQPVTFYKLTFAYINFNIILIVFHLYTFCHLFLFWHFQSSIQDKYIPLNLNAEAEDVVFLSPYRHL